jgi:hypothetical protein
MSAQEALAKAEKKLDDVTKKNAGDMGSNAAIWAGSGAPPPITAGDAATMAAPRPGFDPSLNPGGPEGIESSHTEATAASAKAAEAKAAPADAKAAPAKKEEKKEAKTLAQAPAGDDGLPPAPAEPTAK